MECGCGDRANQPKRKGKANQELHGAKLNRVLCQDKPKPVAVDFCVVAALPSGLNPRRADVFQMADQFVSALVGIGGLCGPRLAKRIRLVLGDDDSGWSWYYHVGDGPDVDAG